MPHWHSFLFSIKFCPGITVKTKQQEEKRKNTNRLRVLDCTKISS